ncbi:MAG: class I SAM-dependent methyltransferase [Pseudomonadota bacterium]
MRPLKTRACPLCARDERAPLPAYSREPWRVVECRSCRFVYLANPPGHAALEEDFAWEETSVSEKQRRLKAAPVMYGLDYATRRLRTAFRPDEAKKYIRWFGNGGNLLDIGCAEGARIGPPFTPYGIELSTALAREADKRMRAQGGYCIHASGADGISQFPATHFDGILMRSYLEHEEEPLKVLRGALRVIKSTGKVYVKVPNYGSVNRRVVGRNWCGFRHPDHVNYFTLSTLRRMAARAGFNTRLLNGLNLAVDDNIHVLLSRA